MFSIYLFFISFLLLCFSFCFQKRLGKKEVQNISKNEFLNDIQIIDKNIKKFLKTTIRNKKNEFCKTLKTLLWKNQEIDYNV